MKIRFLYKSPKSNLLPSENDGESPKIVYCESWNLIWSAICIHVVKGVNVLRFLILVFLLFSVLVWPFTWIQYISQWNIDNNESYRRIYALLFVYYALGLFFVGLFKKVQRSSNLCHISKITINIAYFLSLADSVWA